MHRSTHSPFLLVAMQLHDRVAWRLKVKKKKSFVVCLRHLKQHGKSSQRRSRVKKLDDGGWGRTSPAWWADAAVKFQLPFAWLKAESQAAFTFSAGKVYPHVILSTVSVAACCHQLNKSSQVLEWKCQWLMMMTMMKMPIHLLSYKQRYHPAKMGVRSRDGPPILGISADKSIEN